MEQSASEKKPAAPFSDEKDTSTESVSTSVGYIVKKENGDSIWFSATPKAKIEGGTFFGTIYDLSEIDEDTVSELQVGQKVKVTHNSVQAGSLPSADTAIGIEIISE
jgi:hypothetical protein